MMKKLSKETMQEWSKLGPRNAMSGSLELLAAERNEVCVLTADLTPTARLVKFKETYPDRFFDVGIAEQNLIDFTAGLAVEGLVPFAVGLAAIVPMRCAEQMRVALGYMNLNAKVISIDAGVIFGPLGNTHYAMDDIAVMRAIPNFTVISPSDPLQIYKTISAIADYEGPVYVRLTGAPGFPVMYSEDFDFQIGKAIEYKEGSDVAFISTGSMLGVVVKAAEILENKGISTRIVDMHTIKPLDTDMLDKVFAENKLIITVEEHSSIGGLGGAVAEYKAGVVGAPKQVMASLGDAFKDIGDYSFMLKQSGLTATALAALAEAKI
jgi:transketolase